MCRRNCGHGAVGTRGQPYPVPMSGVRADGSLVWQGRDSLTNPVTSDKSNACAKCSFRIGGHQAIGVSDLLDDGYETACFSSRATQTRPSGQPTQPVAF